MTAAAERIEFQAEIRQVLDIMIHSLYTHREIFLRELISNASDALNKRRYEAVTRHELAPAGDDYRIDIKVDPGAGTLSIADNGIGMNRAEIVDHLGTIAKSGSRAFVQGLKEAKDAPELIGRFGVGFYSAFMVADRVEVITRRAGESAAWRWISEGDGGYTIEETVKDEPGTTVLLHLKPSREEEDENFSEADTLRAVVRKYSDYITYPIRIESAGSTDAKNEPVNAMKPIWSRNPKDVTPQEYGEFFRHITHGWGEPFRTIHFSAEGTLEYQAVLFIPGEAPFELFNPERKHGIHLYARRVFIMDECAELLPTWLRFVKGVVDCSDIALNVSRETVQKSREVALIRKRLVKKVIDTLAETKEQDVVAYRGFWKEFGAVLKEGLCVDEAERERLAGLLLASTDRSEDPISLDEYVSRMPEGQKEIYWLSGPTRAELLKSPHLEAVSARGFEVLFFVDPVDEFMLTRLSEHAGRPLKSVAKGELDLGAEGAERKKEQEKEFSGVVEFLKEQLKGEVADVRVSTRLTGSPSCLVSHEHGYSAHFEKLLSRHGEKLPPARRILEINPTHALVVRARELFEKDRSDAKLADLAYLLYGLGAIPEGVPISDPGRFTRIVSSLV